MSKILVVDDEVWVLEIICAPLQKAGHVCTSALNGDEALELCWKNDFDLAIVDRKMPGMDGIAFIQTLRRTARFQNLKVLMCSAANHIGAVSEASAAGANDYLFKPFDVDVLVKKVTDLLTH